MSPIKNNQGFAVLIKYLPESNIFGVHGFEEDGRTVYARKLDPSTKPSLIYAHGTRVTLFGMSLEHDKKLPPDEIYFKK